ncbi:MAG TPA: LysR family transcriptional regulator [Paraburkholderia sp.]|jgi:DNA-binding transcriptional LysR family regulator
MRKNLDSGVLHAMRAFVCVVDAGSFSQAAEQVQLTTAQVSRLVSDLEKRLQAKLLQRNTRRQTLTEAGTAYLASCRQILDLVAQAEAQAGGAALAASGRLRVQCMTNFGQHYVSPLLPEFFKRHPAVQIEYNTSQYAPDLLARGTDVSLYLAAQLPDSALVSRRLGTTFSVLCASPAYLARNGEPKAPADLAGHACLQLVNPSVSLAWKLVGQGPQTHQLAPEGPCVADSPDVVREVAEAGAGITLLPLFTVIDSVRAGKLVRVLEPWRSPDIGVFALMPSRDFLDAKTRAWLSFLEERLVPVIEEDAQYFRSA